MKKKNVMGLVIAVILVLGLLNLDILPIPSDFVDSFKKTLASDVPIMNIGWNTLAKLLAAIVAISIVYIASWILKSVVSKTSGKNSREKTVAELILSLIRYISVIIGAVWVLSIIGVDVSTILASLGIVGLILGFGAQSLVEDVITGIFIIFEGQYNIGDIIVLDDFRGVVKRIGVRSTTLEDDGGNLKIINNSDIRNIQNRSVKPSAIGIDIPISYNTDMDKFDKLIDKAVIDMYEKHKDIYLEAPKYAGIESLAERTINLKFVVYANEKDIFTAKRILNKDVYDLFKKYNNDIALPQAIKK